MLRASSTRRRFPPLLVFLAMSSIRSVCGAVLNSAHVAGSGKYEPIPDDFKLKQVVVVHRHGDRSQIARSIGPKYPESAEVKAFWQTKMPSQTRLKSISRVAMSTIDVTKAAMGGDIVAMSELPDENAYSGEDRGSFPYAMLTEQGSNQLNEVGKSLRQRYFTNLDVDKDLYSRSTNMCRTLQSLRSLLLGLIGNDDVGGLTVKIDTRAKKLENMFPNADGPCDALTARRNVIFPPQFMEENFDGFINLDSRVKEALGFTEVGAKVSWLTAKEILTCRHVHGLPLPDGISVKDEEEITALAGRMWGVLHQDDIYNLLAIGRFIGELLDDLQLNRKDKKLLIYSGHDSTLVPLLCALGCYDGVWPPYASYLALEFVESKTSGELLVRAVYNDVPVAMTSCGSGNSIWCPFADFASRMKDMSLSSSDYKQACMGGETPLQNNFEAEVKATIG